VESARGEDGGEDGGEDSGEDGVRQLVPDRRPASAGGCAGRLAASAAYVPTIVASTEPAGLHGMSEWTQGPRRG